MSVQLCVLIFVFSVFCFVLCPPHLHCISFVSSAPLALLVTVLETFVILNLLEQGSRLENRRGEHTLAD